MIPGQLQAVQDPTSDQNFRRVTDFLTALGGRLASFEATNVFLRLVTPASRKINFGSVQVEFAGGTNISKAATVTHEIGATPKAVHLQHSGFEGEVTDPQVTSVGATTFEVRFVFKEFKPVAGSKSTIYWTAIG